MDGEVRHERCLTVIGLERRAKPIDPMQAVRDAVEPLMNLGKAVGGR